MSAEGFRPCLVVPVYEHAAALAQALPGLRAPGLEILLVDDGSSAEGAEALARLARETPGVRLRRRERNGGKGAAVKEGLAWAAALGYTHALQVDADGQHDPAALPRLLAEARREPAACVCARPVFGPDAPARRLRWRRLSTFWAAVNTLSRAIPDALCGLRVYPLAATLPRLAGTGSRMEFDPEILVRLAWAGVPLRFLDAAVRYPEGGRSGFRAVEDNVRISWMHARLFFGMLPRAPRLLWRRAASPAP